MRPGNAKKLASAINHWLKFQKLCGKESLFSEKYLSHPVGDFLLNTHSGILVSEVNHPILNSQRAKGCPRQIDFCLYDNNSEMTAAFEIKWVYSRAVNWQLIVNDIFRLEALRHDNRPHVYRYIVIVGKRPDFKNYFLKHKNFKNFFSTKIDISKDVKFSELPNKQKNMCVKFHEEYNADLPISFSTKCLYHRNTGSDYFTIGVWQVCGKANRKLYRPGC